MRSNRRVWVNFSFFRLFSENMHLRRWCACDMRENMNALVVKKALEIRRNAFRASKYQPLAPDHFPKAARVKVARLGPDDLSFSRSGEEGGVFTRYRSKVLGQFLGVEVGECQRPTRRWRVEQALLERSGSVCKDKGFALFVASYRMRSVAFENGETEEDEEGGGVGGGARGGVRERLPAERRVPRERGGVHCGGAAAPAAQRAGAVRAADGGEGGGR
jgi:hypothetical protein